MKEFPMAPKDSFLVANASYIAQQTKNTGQYFDEHFRDAKAESDPANSAANQDQPTFAPNEKAHPPPEFLFVPWGYLTILIVMSTLSTI